MEGGCWLGGGALDEAVPLTLPILGILNSYQVTAVGTY